MQESELKQSLLVKHLMDTKITAPADGTATVHRDHITVRSFEGEEKDYTLPALTSVRVKSGDEVIPFGDYVIARVALRKFSRAFVGLLLEPPVESNDEAFQFIHVPVADFFGTLQPRDEIHCRLEMLPNGMTKDVALECDASKFRDFADELFDFLVAVERFTTPLAAKVSPLDERLAGVPELIQWLIVSGRSCHREPAERATQRRRHFLKPVLNPCIESAAINSRRLAFVEFLKSGREVRFNGALAQNLSAKRVDGSNMRLF